MKEAATSAQLCLDGPGGFTYVVATLRYIVREDETFRYELMPNYQVIDLLDSRYYQGIPGFDLSKEKPMYARENTTPTLIADRAPMENREDLWQLLAEYDMDYLDPVEWLIRSNKRYIGDNLYFRAAQDSEPLEPVSIDNLISKAPSTYQAVKKALVALCEGDQLLSDGKPLERNDRKLAYQILFALHEKMERGAEAGGSPKEKPAVGRKRKPVDELMLKEAVEDFRAKRITAKQAAQNLDVSQATFYRRMAEMMERSQLPS